MFNQFTIAGSLVAGSRDTADTLKFAAEQHVSPSVEVAAMADVNNILKRLIAGDFPKDVFRFVLKN